MSILESILMQHPVRRTEEQKEAFRAWLSEETKRLGYAARVEPVGGRSKSNNVVIGDPEKAAVIFTAHYDTPAGFFLPNFMTPRNRVFHWARQAGMILLFVLMAAAVGVPVWLLTGSDRAGFLAGYVLYMALALSMLIGPANRSNVNDNTSGVAAMMELMGRIPAEKRDLVAFVFFDNEEKGLVGSKAYAKAHPAVKENGFVVNMDCVGDGDHVLLISSEKARAAKVYPALTQGMEAAAGRTLHVFPLESSVGSSDHKSFKQGSVLYACKESKYIGYYCDRIHTSRDTICNQGNLDYVADGLARFVDAL